MSDMVNPQSGVRHSVSECGAESGITVGLIDAVLAICKVLADRNLITSNAVAEALRDMHSDKSLRYVLDTAATISAEHT